MQGRIIKELTRLKERTVTQSRIIVVMAVILVICFSALVSVGLNLNIVKKQQEDTLNVLNDMRLEIDAIKTTETQIIKEEKATAEEIKRIAEICTAESSTLEGQMAVAEVILNRSKMWNKSLIEVIEEPHQFANPKKEVTEETLNAVAEVLNGEVTVFADNKPTYFHADWFEPPYWTAGRTDLGVVGGNRFYG